VSLCIAIAGKVTALAVSAFTLSWSHSVEKTAWQEEWRLVDGRLAVVSARIEGSGAGMEPPADARFDGMGWVYEPRRPPQRRLVLADSGAAGAWRLCAAGECLTLGGDGRESIVLEACP
jgi:hypothetical protein